MQNLKAKAKFQKNMPPEEKQKVKVHNVQAKAKFENFKAMPPEKKK